MLKKRIIATVVVKDGIVVQSRKFKNYLPLGKVSVALEFLDKWGIDEIVLLDISATRNNVHKVLDDLQNAVKNCFVPLTYGGGLKDISMVYDAFKKGADKVSFNSAFRNNHDLIAKTAAEFGKQSVVISIDFVEKDGLAYVYDYERGEVLDMTLQEAIDRAEHIGVGEIFINCVNRDGIYNGFALNAVQSLKSLDIPLILAGGARYPTHFLHVLKLDQVSAVAAGNMFHFVEHSVTKLKAQIKSGLVRKDAEFNYYSHKFKDDQRIEKLSDKVLEGFLYEKLLDQDI